MSSDYEKMYGIYKLQNMVHAVNDDNDDY